MTRGGEAPRRGRPSAFTDDELLAVAQELGPDHLALRDVSAALGVPRTTLYNRITGPEQLGSLVLLSLLRDAAPEPWSPRAEAGWQECLHSFAQNLYDQLVAAGPWLRFFAPEVHIAEQTYAAADRVLESLVVAGLPAVRAGRALWFVCGVVSEGVRVHGMSLEPSEVLLRQQTLETYRWVSAARPTPGRLEPAEQFAYALERALDGIAADVQRHCSPEPP